MKTLERVMEESERMYWADSIASNLIRSNPSKKNLRVLLELVHPE